MTRFVQTVDDGWINLEHIARVHRRYGGRLSSGGKGREIVDVLQMPDGSLINCKLMDDPDDFLGGEIIPAASGTVALVIWVDDSERPTEDKVWMQTLPILGWRDCGDYRKPLFVQDIASNQRSFLEADGKFHELSYDGTIYESLDALKTELLIEAQSSWDRAAKKADTA